MTFKFKCTTKKMWHIRFIVDGQFQDIHRLCSRKVLYDEVFSASDWCTIRTEEMMMMMMMMMMSLQDRVQSVRR